VTAVITRSRKESTMSEKKTKKAPSAERAPTITPADFVVGWQKCASLTEAREKLGSGASARAQRMRKAGVKLQAFASGRTPIDVKALNALIAK